MSCSSSGSGGGGCGGSGGGGASTGMSAYPKSTLTLDRSGSGWERVLLLFLLAQLAIGSLVLAGSASMEPPEPASSHSESSQQVP